MMYSFASGRSPFSWLSLLPGVSSERLWLRRLIAFHLDRVVGMRGYYSLYGVPRRLLPHLDLPARRSTFEPGGGGSSRSIFDALRSSAARARAWDYRVPEEAAFAALEASIAANEAEFYLLYAAGLDAELHRAGTGDRRIADRLAWYRERIERVARVAGKLPGGARIHVFGDHGILDVERCVDVMSGVEKLALRMPGDFLPFYDATMARFRVFSARARGALEELLSNQAAGRLLPPAELRDLGVFFEDGRFGDLVFLANAGVMLVPSFMGGEPVAAMHGYHPDSPGMDSLFLTNAEGELPEGILDLAGILVPGFAARTGGGRP
jgi:hypothetical protein